jgi:hypothetical protein
MSPGKPMASLSSSLLARKGQARPAMRPQGYVSLSPNPGDDLGWNDMGEDFAPPPGMGMPPMGPGPVAVPPAAPVLAPAPEVLRQRAALDEQFPPVVAAPAPAPVAETAPVAEVAPRLAATKGAVARAQRQARTGTGKAAFTLRLDNDRHLRLRLASAVTNRSAQQLVTEALDAFLESLTEVDTLATQLSARDGRTGS